MRTAKHAKIDSDHMLRAKTPWGSLAQYMVLFNGFILTITAYLFLNYFISQMAANERAQTTAHVEETVHRAARMMEGAVRASAALTSELRGEDAARRRAKMLYAMPPVHYLDGLYWIKKDAKGSWSFEEFFSSQNTQNLSRLSEQVGAVLIQRILAGAEQERGDLLMLSDFPWSASSEQMGNAMSSQDFILARPLRDQAGRVDSIIVGTSRIGNIFDAGWLDRNRTVRAIGFGSAQDIRPLYLLNRSERTVREISDLEADKIFNATIGNRAVNVRVGVAPSTAIALLGMAPLFTLFFGGALTLLGTFFVRGNFRQAQRISAMNHELAKKNYELKLEVEEREKTALAMRKSEREFRAMMDSVSDIIFETMADGRIILLNGAWERITGFTVEHSQGQDLFDMFHAQDAQDQRRNFDDLVKGRRHAYRGEVRLRTVDGAYRMVEISLSMLRQDNEKRTIVVGSMTDVEERRRAEKALGEAERKYRTIVDNAAGGIFQITPEGTVLSANPSLLRILGFDTMEQMMHEMRNMLDYIFSTARDKAKFMRDMEFGSIVKNFECEGRMRDGERIWLNLNARAVRDDDGNILYFEGSLENITQRKLAEYRLRDAKIQSDLASRAKSEFLANMSHELRTPLNAIIGFSEIIRNEVLGPIGNRQYWDYAKDIHESGCRLLTIINEILDVSRISAGERHLNESEVDIVDVTRGALDFIAQRAQEGGLELVNLVRGPAVPFIRGEELAIKQILLNLLSNAVKFTPEGGRITVSCESDSDGQFRLSVSDTGIGLDEMEIEKALSPFGQVDSAMNRTSSGAGLGLTLVDSLIKLHNGQLELFSQKGIGTTASVVFPYKRVIRQAPAKNEALEDGAPVGASGPAQGENAETRH